MRWPCPLLVAILGCRSASPPLLPPDARACALTSAQAGGGAQAIATGDLDNDGRVDVVTANFRGNSVSVLLGNGDGTFRDAVDYPSGGPAEDVIVGDFNGDGNLDVGVTGWTDAVGTMMVVGVLLGNGNGTLRPMISSSVNQPGALVAGSFGASTRLDLAVDVGGSSVDILLGNGDGTFQHSAFYSTGTNPDTIAVADVDADGHADLIVGNAGYSCSCFFNCGPCENVPGSAVLLRGRGDGTFDPANAVIGGDVFALTVADLNRDGKTDLLVRGWLPPVVLLGNGDGSFGSPIAMSREDALGLVLATADLDGDGTLDVVEGFVFGGTLANTVAFRHGQGDGTFDDPIAYAVGQRPGPLAVADVDRDFEPDVIVIDQADDTIKVMLSSCFR
jgi:hypothetical protein